MKKVLFTAFLAVMYLTGCTQKEMTDLPRGTATPEMTAAVDSFVEATKSRPAPPDSILMHSVSKTFTATAIGLAINEGKLNLTDKVVSFFPDQLPTDSSKYLYDMTVRDLLTMTCGHDEEPNVRRERRCGRLASQPFEDRTDI